MSVVNGVGPPVLGITAASGVKTDITLPLPERNTEDPNPVETKHPAFDHSEIIDFHGYKPRWTLDYSTHIDGSVLLQLRYLLEGGIRQILLTPHNDLPGRQFKVRLVDPGVLYRMGADVSTGWHAGLKLVFECIDLLDAIPFPQAGLTGRTWADCGNEVWTDHNANVWHFFT
ncbi:MAG: hypothetical protein ACKVRP_14630 [Bacteroidota bacterium]